MKRAELEKQKEKLLAESKAIADRMKDAKQEIEGLSKVCSSFERHFHSPYVRPRVATEYRPCGGTTTFVALP